MTCDHRIGAILPGMDLTCSACGIPLAIIPAESLKVARIALREAVVAQDQLLRLAGSCGTSWAIKNATDLIKDARAALGGAV